MIQTSLTRPGALGMPGVGIDPRRSGTAVLGDAAAVSVVAGSVAQAAKRRCGDDLTGAIARPLISPVAVHDGRDVTDLGTSTKVQDPARSGPM